MLFFLLFIAALALAGGVVWYLKPDWFRDSETIFWARFQIFVSAVGAVMVATDLSPLFATGIPTPQQMVLFGIVFVQGIVTEYLRRRRADDL